MVEGTPKLTIRLLTPDDWSILTKLFGSNGACGGCWCMWPRVPRGGKAWEEASRIEDDVENLLRGLGTAPAAAEGDPLEALDLAL